MDFLSTCNPLKLASSAIRTDVKPAGSRSFNLDSQGSFIEAEPPNPGCSEAACSRLRQKWV